MYRKRAFAIALLLTASLLTLNNFPPFAHPAHAAIAKDENTNPVSTPDIQAERSLAQDSTVPSTPTPEATVQDNTPDDAGAIGAHDDSTYFSYMPLMRFYKRPYYYISTNGVDPYDCSGGTQSRPWRTWAKAEKCIPPGAIVYFTAGTYYGVFSGSRQCKINFAGRPGQPTEIRPAPGDEGQVHFNQIIEIYGEHGVLSGIDINASSAYAATAVAIGEDSANIVLQDNRIHDSKRHRCVNVFRNADSVSIVNNEIYNCGVDPSNQTIMGVGLETTGGTNIIFRGNHIYNAKGGIQIKGGASNVLVENNLVHDIVSKSGIFGTGMGALGDPYPSLGNSVMHEPSTAIQDRYQAKNVVVRNNIIYNNYPYSALSPAGWTDYHICNNTIFNQFGNVVFYITSGSWEFFDETALAYCATHRCSPCTSYEGRLECVKIYLPSRNGEIENNLIYSFDKVLKVEPGNATNLKIATNLYYAQGFGRNTPGTYKVNGREYTFAAFQTLGYEAGSLIADPRFLDIIDTANPNLKLQTTSPAIDSGIPLPDVNQDFDGVARPQGLSHDIGSYEFSE